MKFFVIFLAKYCNCFLINKINMTFSAHLQTIDVFSYNSDGFHYFLFAH